MHPRNPQACGQENLAFETSTSSNQSQSQSHTHDGNCHCGHDHSADIESMELDQLANDLYPSIDITGVRIFNSDENNSDPRSIFGPWNTRHNLVKYVKSDVDETLIIHIPFVDTVQLHSIFISAPTSHSTDGYAGACPRSLSIYKNTFLDFDQVEYETPDETITMNQDDQLHIPVNPRKFFGVNSLTFYISENYGHDVTKINFIGLRGFSKKRILSKAPVTTYELNGNFADHPEIIASQSKAKYKHIQ